MKNTFIKTTAFLLVAVIFLAMTIVPAIAAPSSLAIEDGFTQLGKKTATQLVVPGQYEITVSVPGAVQTEKYSEVIVMVDASSSQGANLKKLKTMLVDLAHEILHGDKSVRLTLMGYGMGPKLAGSFYDADMLEAWIADITQADLRQGVSATNCEAALNFINDYINKSKNLENTFVIFTSDGKTNMDETTYALSDWQNHPEWWSKGVTVKTIISATAGGICTLLVNKGITVSAVANLYPDDSEELAVILDDYGISSNEYKSAVDAFYAKLTSSEQDGINLVNAVWADVFSNSGYDYANGKYSTSVLEKAFLDFHGGVLCSSFYSTIHRMMNAGFYPDYYGLTTWGKRSSAASDALASNAKVTDLYMMDFSSKINNWMNPASTSAYHCTSSKISYHTATSFGDAVDLIGKLGNEIFVTLYKNVTVIDPMSKWVNLDPDTIRIYDDKKLIYEYGKGWLYENNQPAEKPIKLEKNADGRYQITWRIKDGPLLFTDRYSLKYIVELDETVDGFEYGKYYPANDPTYVTYRDENDKEKKVDVSVPVIKEHEEEHFDKNDKGIKIYKSSSVDKTPLSDIQFEIYHVVPANGEKLTQNPPVEEYSKYMTEENKIITVTTDINGYASVNLTELGYDDFGYYLFVELPNEKVKAPADPFYVSVPMVDPDTKEIINVVSIYPKNEPVDTPPPPPPPTVEEEFGTFSIRKHSAVDTSVVLSGAEFQVYRLARADENPILTTTTANGTVVNLVPLLIDDQIVELRTDKNGYAVSPELEYDIYYLVETRSPIGYNIDTTPIPVFATKTGYMTEYSIDIANSPGVFLPETGGPGTILLTAFGIALCGIAVVLMIARRKSY